MRNHLSLNKTIPLTLNYLGWEKDKKLAENNPQKYGHLMSIHGRFSYNFAITVSQVCNGQND